MTEIRCAPARKLFAALVMITCGLLPTDATATTVSKELSRVPVTLSGGHETDSRDNGRPVVLIAAALGVPSEVFRQAFSRVTPARGGKPEPSQARENKRVLMDALAPHGISNERLDEVSNYYRYRPQSGELWPTKPAVVEAVINGGRITALEVKSGGSGYSSQPVINVPSFGPVPVEVQLNYGKAFETNGSVAAIKLRQ